jgi:glycosyltransferase involved in cell wall biosynthesis
MRVALATPVAFPSVRGNAVTVDRLADGLRRRGVIVDVLDLSRIPPDGVGDRLAGFAPQLIHAFHAFDGGPAVAPYARAHQRPLVLSVTGTDVNTDLLDPARRPAVLAALRGARAIVAFTESMAGRVAREAPDVAARLTVIPQSVALGAEPYPLGDVAPRIPGEVRFLLPAGIRRVKNVLFPLAALGGLAARLPLRLLLAGPAIEDAEGARLIAALKRAEWATWLGEVPHAQIASLLEQIDVVLNTSLSEGGMANALLEAMACGRAVLASDIEGNRSLIEPGVDGLLYRDAADLVAQAERLITDPALRARLGAAARAKVARRYRPERELDAHLALYRRLIAA